LSEPATQSAGFDKALLRRLGRLRAGLRLRLLGRGAAWLLLTLLVAAVVTFIVDYGLYRMTLQHLSVAQRLFVMVLCVAAVGFVAWRHLLRPLSRRFNADDMALVVERTHPQLADRLISALQLSREADRSDRHSPQLVRRIMSEAETAATPDMFSDALRWDRALRPLTIAIATALLLAAIAVARADIALPWLQRNVLLNSNEYPRRTTLHVDADDVIRVVRGGSLEVAVTADADRVVPPHVTFHMDLPSVGKVNERAEADAKQLHRYVKRFEVVGEPFSFYVTGGDARTRTVRVEVAEPPRLQSVQFTIERPAYMNQPVETSDGSSTTMKLPAGSQLQFRATSTKPLRSAELLLESQPVADTTVADDHTIHAALTLLPTQTGRSTLSLHVALTDSAGFTNRQAASYRIELLADEPPTAQLAAIGLASQISKQARIPLSITVADDYGVAGVELEWALLSGSGDATRLPVAALTPPRARPQPMTYVFDLAEQDPPVADIGESIRLQAIVHDTRPKPGGPNRTLSNVLTLRVVPDDEVLASLMDSQRVMREQFRQIVAMQSDVKSKTSIAASQARNTEALPQARQLVSEAADLQQQAHDMTRTVASRFDVILQRMVNNRVGAELDRQRLQQKVVNPLNQLLQMAMPRLSAELGSARETTDGPALATQLDSVLPLQVAVLQQMEQILAEMIKVENAQEVERGLKTIIRMSEQVREMTRPEDDNTTENDKREKENDQP